MNGPDAPVVARPRVAPTAEAAGAPPLFTLQGASFGLPERTLLHPLDLVIQPRQVVGLIGHNGSGKSTLIKLLGRQQAPTAGRIAFADRALSAWEDRAFAREVAYLPQALPPVPGMTVRELVALGRYPWHGALGRVADRDREAVRRALAATGVAAFADRFVDTLSGGERQRVWLAMMIAQEPACLLLDEPISALDVAHAVEILALVRDLAHRDGLGVVVVLHDVNMAARVCDRILALHSGRLIADGPPGTLMNPDTLRAVYDIPMGVMPHPDTGRPLSYLRGS
ncbi:iron complex transport system ATP-binding protein [Methylobacterium sp. UNC300MFChir4.1]|uniref:ATP-binding cassette domain-containing protein n=1 Tax=Methylobacterium sp. UNC300MFChir4.1 TaxID=1502747 RepID=UPI0008B36589|nr:ATP-binding cassette domain-containing protein [Methylobacterium sp. UNC300MFChir4.1]SEP38132.1 iron complex transport system ATP-binding protein [Methylobacterium sp. UNC300MFChir4.1]